jgi:hypothetical protein
MIETILAQVHPTFLATDIHYNYNPLKAKSVLKAMQEFAVRLLKN